MCIRDRTRSVYEAAREALLFGVEPSVEQTDVDRKRPEVERIPVSGFGWTESYERGRASPRNQETARKDERAPPRQTSVWDALDEIGRERETTQEQSASTDAMARIQERTAEQLRERETEEAERQKLEREKQEREQDRDIGIGYGF